MKKFYITLTTLLAFVVTFSNLKAQVTVDATLGTTTGSYTTLKAAIDNINNGTHQGAIDIRIHASTTETAAISLDSSGRGGVVNYTSILIRPADTATSVKSITTSAALAGLFLFTLQGSDNVTIDGRPLSAGANKLLQFVHTGTTASSNILNYINGASFNSVKYCTFTSSSVSVVTVAVYFNTSAATTGNTNDSVQYCDMTGCRYGVYMLGTVANPANNIYIKGNNIINFGVYGVYASAVKNFTVDSNSLYHNIAVASGSNPIAIYLGANCDAYVATITRNRIYDLQTNATSGIYGIYVTPSLATPVVTPIINCYNNFVSLTQSSGTASGVYGMYFLGTTPAICRFIHNSIRIGGTHTAGTAGAVVSYGMIKTNTSTTSTFVSRGNVIINNRTGGTSGVFHTGFRIQLTAMVGTMDIDYNIYWATGTAGSGPFPATWGNTLYDQTGQTAYRNAAAAVQAGLEANSQFGNVTFTSNTDLSLSGTSINNYQLMGAPRNALVLNDIYGATRGIITYKGAHQSVQFTNLKDASVKEVYSLGKLPVPYAAPHTIRANIQNTGIDTLFNQKVKVVVSGTNSFADSVFIDTIIPGQNKYAVFSAFNYMNPGTCIVTVSLPNDSTNSNNSKVFNQIITSGTYAYADPTLPAVGGVGFNGVGGDFIAKFPYAGSNNINQVGVNFNTGGQPFQIVIYSVLNDTPGVQLWSSTTQTAVAGINTINVNPVVPISGSFFVGVRQTGTTNVGFGYQAEDPIRNGVFYYKATTATGWADFASTNSAFRFMVEPRLQIADDIGVQAVTLPCNVVVQNSPPIFPKVRVFNYGLNGYSSLTVKCSITGPATYTNTTFVPSVSLSSNTSTDVMLSTSFNPTTVGTYTMKVWTQLSGDLEPNNDTVTYIFNVTNINTFTDAGNHIVLNGTNQSLTIPYNGSLDNTGSMLTLETWVNPSTTGFKYFFSKEQSSGVPQYAFYMNPASNLIFTLRTLNGIDSVVSTKYIPILTYSHIAATYDGTSIRLYINGDTAGTKPMSGALMSSTSPLYIGQSYLGGTSFLGGNLDDVKIWDTVRTDNQIRLAMYTRNNNFSNTALKGYWRMDETTGSYAADAAGNCNNGIINGAATFATSNLSLGTPLVQTKTISSTGLTTFSTAGVNINTYNQAGSNDYYAFKFVGAPRGTLPSTSPGGVINVNNNTWIINKYGTGTMDSSVVDFFVGSGIPTSPVNADIKLFSRELGSNGNWVKLRDAAYGLSFATQKVSMMVAPTEFNKQFSLGANSSALPVKLLYFSGRTNDADVVLNWATGSEINNANFIIERSMDGKIFEKINSVEGKGNSNEINNYSITDEKVFEITGSKQLYYRLVQIDFDGKTEVSNTVVVNANGDDQTTTSVYPNPFSDEVNIVIDASVKTDAKILVIDITGKTVLEMNSIIEPGVNNVHSTSLASLPKGIYILQLSINGGVSIQKLVKQ